jgi:hypothetical protein
LYYCHCDLRFYYLSGNKKGSPEAPFRIFVNPGVGLIEFQCRTLININYELS